MRDCQAHSDRLSVNFSHLSLSLSTTIRYGTQQPIALLKLFFERGGMFDRDKDLNWKKFKDMTFYAAMGTAGGGRNEVDPRFISMFSTYNIVFPNDESLIQIYSSIFKGHLNYTKFQQRFMMVADMIVVMTLKLFKVCNSIRALSYHIIIPAKVFHDEKLSVEIL